MHADALFLDFDGVICDSIRECFASSWIAFHERYRGDSPKAIGLADFAAFRALRPFIRAGRDFVFIQEMILDGISAQSQAEFDRLAERAGNEKLGTFDSLLYQVREELVREDLGTWLRLNRPFGALPSALREAANSPRVWIISTKRPEYIHRILGDWEVHWPRDRIVLPADESKIDVISRLMADNGFASGVFVDDQPDHLSCEPQSRLTCIFAGWAHGILLAPDQAHVESIDLDGLCELISEMTVVSRVGRESPIQKENDTRPG